MAKDSCLNCGKLLPANKELASVPNARLVAFDPDANRVWRICDPCGHWNLLGPEAARAATPELLARYEASAAAGRPGLAMAVISGKLLLLRVGAAPNSAGAAMLAQEVHAELGKGLTWRQGAAVLVILGLLTGGILTGQNLIRAAELRTLSTEYQNYVTATHTFRDKYFALPGDMSTATKFWGDDNAACADAAVPNGTPGTCNGNGDGIMNGPAAINLTGEMFQFWKQLALAGLVEGSYTGLATSINNINAQVGVNVPGSKMSNVGWTAYYRAVGGTDEPVTPIGNHFRVGAYGANTTVYPFLKPEEQWNIDTKMDDGKPARGIVMPLGIASCTDAGAAAGSELDLDAEYLLTNTAVVCRIFFLRAF